MGLSSHNTVQMLCWGSRGTVDSLIQSLKKSQGFSSPFLTVASKTPFGPTIDIFIACFPAVLKVAWVTANGAIARVW